MNSCNSRTEKSTNSTGIIYSNVIVIDGLGNAPYSASLLIQDGLIKQIFKDQSDFSKYEMIDCSNKYVLPGLIDTHIHATVLDYDQKDGHQSSVDFEASQSSLNRMTEYGVMYARSVAGPLEEGLELRQMALDNPNDYPEIFVSGLALNKSDHPPFRKVMSEKDVHDEIEFQYENGADHIKVYASLEPKLVEVAIKESHKRGLKVVGHFQRTNWTQASQMGVDFITHASPWSAEYLPIEYRSNYSPTMKGRLHWIEYVDYDSELIKEMIMAMKSNGITFDPTLVAFHTKFWENDSLYIYNSEREILPKSIAEMWNSASYVGDWTKEDFDKGQSLWPKLIELTYRIYKAGIPITVGTDFPNPWIYPGLSVHKEMQLLHESGIPTLDVIKMATYNGAVALGIDGKTGSIDVGKKADLIFLNSNPIENMANTLDIAWIVKAGVKSN